MANEKRLIDANALMDAIEVTDWYHISPKGYLQKGANSQIHTPLFKADDIFQALKDAPTVDAVEVVRGHKVVRSRCRGIAYAMECPICLSKFPSNKPFTENVEYCSVCGKKLDDTFQNYCPNCGAKMDGDGNA